MNNPELRFHKSLFVRSNSGSITQEYLIGKQLGKGAYGIVYEARLKGCEKMRAIKQIKKSSIRNPATIENQISILKKLDHPKIIKIYETFEDDQNYYVVTDMCEGGELFDKLIQKGSFNQSNARYLFQQMLYAVKYCHTEKVAHRDLKPENFLLLNKDSLSLKLIDFGLSYQWTTSMRQQLKQKKENKLIGTSYYISPDILKGQYDERCDIWSLGVILYILVTAVPPFDGENDKGILQSVRKGAYTFDIPEMKKVSPMLKDLISRILVPESSRLTIDQIYQHPWMNMENGTLDFKVNLGKIANFSKFSKVKYLLLKLKTFAATCITSQMTGKQIERLGEQFKQIDLDHDGFITVQEMRFALQKQKQIIPWPELAQLLRFVDTDKNGKINYSEFIACSLENSTIFKQENLAHVFQRLDGDRDGRISKDELRSAMFRRFNINPENDFEMERGVIEQIMRQCDKNGDGFIDFKEFLHGISQL